MKYKKNDRKVIFYLNICIKSNNIKITIINMINGLKIANENIEAIILTIPATKNPIKDNKDTNKPINIYNILFSPIIYGGDDGN